MISIIRLIPHQTKHFSLSPQINNEFMQIGALKALKFYNTIIKSDNYYCQLDKILTGACYLSNKSYSDTLYLILDVLIKVLNSAVKQPASITPFIHMLTETTLLLWKRLADDAYSNTYIMDIVQLLITGGNYDNFIAVSSKLVPVITSIFSMPEMMVEKVTAMTLLSSIFQSFGELLNSKHPNGQELLLQISGAVVGPMFQIAVQYSEDGLMDAVIRTLKWYFAAVIKATNQQGGQFLHQLPVGSSNALHLSIQFILKMLSPSVNDISAQNIGGLVNLMVASSFPLLIDQHLLSPLIHHVVERLITAKLPDFQSGLIIVICRLFLLDAAATIELLHQTPLTSPPINRKPSSTALEFFLRLWSKFITHFMTEMENTIMLSALSHLLLVGDPRVTNQLVPGELISKVKREGLRSAAKAKNNEEEWSEVPFVVKAFTVLVEELIKRIIEIMIEFV